MTIIKEIKADMAAGTAGPWHEGRFWSVHPSADIGGTIASTSGRSGAWQGPDQASANARRIARVPEMEALVLAGARAVELLREYREKTPLGHQPHMISERADEALTAWEEIADG